jgi:transposase
MGGKSTNTFNQLPSHVWTNQIPGYILGRSKIWFTFSAFKYRIYPKPEQEMRLKRSLLSLCQIYNRLRVKKIEERKQNNISLTKTNLRATALDERRHDPGLQLVYSQVVQNVADRVCFAFENFFEGGARFPKNKQPRKYLSMTYPQAEALKRDASNASWRRTSLR